MNILKKKIIVFIGTSSFKFLDKKKINKLKKKMLKLSLIQKKEN